MAIAEFNIGKKKVGANNPCFVIAEIAQAHDGSLGLAHSFIDAAAAAGMDAIKFQTHIAHAESTKEEEFRINFSYEDKTRYEYWKRMEFTKEQWQGLYDHAQEKGLVFLSSPFSVAAVELLHKIGTPAWKIGSGEVNNPLLFSAILATKKPILLSTGMSYWQEIANMVERIQKHQVPLAIFQCTSKYPTAMDEVGLNVISELQIRYQVPAGLSDHTGSIYPFLAAMAQGANIIEFHVTFDRRMFGPDAPVSLTFEEAKIIADGRNAFYTMAQNPINKDRMAEQLARMRSLFNKSVALKENQKAGTVLSEEMLTTKKPGTGIPAEKLCECVGKALKKDVCADTLLSYEDLK